MRHALLGGLGAATLLVAGVARAELIASFENSAEGWSISSENPAYAISGFSTTTGVTDQSYSMIVTGSAAPTYGQMLFGPSSAGLTAKLAAADQILIDITTDAGSFDWGSQWTAVINGGGLGYVSLDGFTYTGFVGPGSSATLAWNITAAQKATLAANLAADSQLIFQVGGGGPGTFYADNVRTRAIPEPAAISLLGALALLGARRRRSV